MLGVDLFALILACMLDCCIWFGGFLLCLWFGICFALDLGFGLVVIFFVFWFCFGLVFVACICLFWFLRFALCLI